MVKKTKNAGSVGTITLFFSPQNLPTAMQAAQQQVVAHSVEITTKKPSKKVKSHKKASYSQRHEAKARSEGVRSHEDAIVSLSILKHPELENADRAVDIEIQMAENEEEKTPESLVEAESESVKNDFQALPDDSDDEEAEFTGFMDDEGLVTDDIDKWVDTDTQVQIQKPADMQVVVSQETLAAPEEESEKISAQEDEDEPDPDDEDQFYYVAPHTDEADVSMTMAVDETPKDQDQEAAEASEKATGLAENHVDPATTVVESTGETAVEKEDIVQDKEVMEVEEPEKDKADEEKETNDADGEEKDDFPTVEMEIPKATKRTPERKFTARYDFSIILEASNRMDMIPMVHNAIHAIHDQIKTLDNTLVVYPWEEASAAETLMTFETVPETSLSEIRVYFPRATPRESGGTLYFSAYMGHDKPFATLHNDISYWFGRSDVRGGWYYKQMQCEDTVALGWLVYSPREIDVLILAAQIEKETKVKVGLRYKTIAVEQGRVLSPEERVMALHIEVNASTESFDRPRIEALYGSKKESGWPLGIKMRLVPERRDTANLRTVPKLDRMRTRQDTFTKAVRRFDDNTITVLDFVDADLGHKTLRQLIMEIPSTRNPKKQLFVSVDRKYRGSGYWLTVNNKLVVEADCRISGGLLPYFRATMPEAMLPAIEKCFTANAVLKSKDVEWDPITKCIVSHADKLMDEFDDNNLDSENDDEAPKKVVTIDLSGMKDTGTGTADSAKQNQAQSVSESAKTTDSVSTFGTAKYGGPKGGFVKTAVNNINAGSNSTRKKASSAAASVASEGSSVATTKKKSRSTASSVGSRGSSVSSSVATRLTQMEAALEGVSSMRAQMAQLTLLVTQLVKTNNPPEENIPASSEDTAAGEEE